MDPYPSEWNSRTRKLFRPCGSMRSFIHSEFLTEKQLSTGSLGSLCSPEQGTQIIWAFNRRTSKECGLIHVLLQMGDLRDKNLNHEFTTPPCSARCKVPRQQKGPHPMSLKLSWLLASTQYGKNQQHHWDVIWFQEHCFNQQNWACEGKTDWGCHHLKLENLCD